MSDESSNAAPVTNPWDEFGADPDRETEGAWVDDFIIQGWRIKVRSINSARARQMQDRQLGRLRSIVQANAGVIPAHIRDRNNAELAAKVLVVAWENIPDPDNPTVMMPCNEANVLRACQHPKMGRKFRDEVMFCASQESLFQATAIEGMAGNSPAA